MEFSNELKDACKSHPTSKEVHVNELGDWHFTKKEGIHESFGTYQTYTIEEVLGNETIKETKKTKKTKK